MSLYRASKRQMAGSAPVMFLDTIKANRCFVNVIAKTTQRRTSAPKCENAEVVAAVLK